MSEMESIRKLSMLLAKLPGVGRRSAERMAMKLARDGSGLIRNLVDALNDVQEEVSVCTSCGGLTDKTRNPCALCTDSRRDARMLCVVEDPGDILLIERAGDYRGRYHALMGKLSPMKGEGVGGLRVEALVKRIEADGVQEVILALGTDVESDATAVFLSHVLAGRKIRISRLAFGIPAGSDLSYADPVTLARALKGRQPV